MFKSKKYRLQIEALKNEVTDHRAQADALKWDLIRRDHEVRSQKATIDRKDDHIRELGLEVRALRNENSTLRNKENARIKELQAKVADLTAEVADRDDEIDTLETELDAADKREGELEDALGRLMAENTHLMLKVWFPSVSGTEADLRVNLQNAERTIKELAVERDAAKSARDIHDAVRKAQREDLKDAVGHLGAIVRSYRPGGLIPYNALTEAKRFYGNFIERNPAFGLSSPKAKAKAA